MIRLGQTVSVYVVGCTRDFAIRVCDAERVASLVILVDGDVALAIRNNLLPRVRVEIEVDDVSIRIGDTYETAARVVIVPDATTVRGIDDVEQPMC